MILIFTVVACMKVLLHVYSITAQIHSVHDSQCFNSMYLLCVSPGACYLLEHHPLTTALKTTLWSTISLLASHKMMMKCIWQYFSILQIIKLEKMPYYINIIPLFHAIIDYVLTKLQTSISSTYFLAAYFLYSKNLMSNCHVLCCISISYM